MVQATAIPPAVEKTARLDLRALHSALAQAASVLEILDVCQSATVDVGGSVWIAACVRPRLCVSACGERPPAAGDLHQALEAMQQACASSVPPTPSFTCAGLAARWRGPQAPESRLDPSQYAQTDLVGNRTYYGLLRVLAERSDNGALRDWEAVGGVIAAATPHLLLTLQEEATTAADEDHLGLCVTDRFMRRLEGEVSRAQDYGGELSLAILEVQAGRGSEPGGLAAHQVGAVARVLRRCLRTSDLACRLPDGRFGVLLPLTSQRNALIACARVIDALQASPELPTRLQCRSGLSGWGEGAETACDLFDQASQALRDARAAGVTGAFLYL